MKMKLRVVTLEITEIYGNKATLKMIDGPTDVSSVHIYLSFKEKPPYELGQEVELTITPIISANESDKE